MGFAKLKHAAKTTNSRHLVIVGQLSDKSREDKNDRQREV